ncbi:NADH dehydrogenase subunit M [Longilinea arvoryzae]|uniref:NADH dehydrogenase subunit M n=1 Tax=Longilinea arvoryzae TaxID=360412 RepID=A0A0S7BHT5_9CHLR|nr:NADH-quinone oxidoreductase subunit M [Longilinea arvoryzae]GAP15277.1 NADH dehydrogenase subunit M [Longilinea arvoryzae]
MDFILNHLLTLILFVPTAAAFLMLFLPKDRPVLLRWWALGASLISFGLALIVWFRFVPGQNGFQFTEQAAWYGVLNASYHVGVDGISLTMVLLTTLLMPLAILASFNIKDRVKPYMILFLLLETGMLGVFMALDLLLFFVFWEVGLVPMYFLIAQWGGSNRNYASLKFMLYTIGGSLGLLLATQLIGVTMGTFDLPVLFDQWPKITEIALPLGLSVATVKTIAFWAFVVAFAVKVPVWPVHTWLPDAHTEAPTAGSMILAGVLLKLGAYGFLRLVLPLYPVEAKTYSGALAFLAVAAIISGALAAWGQTDFKRLVAYSSINHMGFVVLGIAAAARAGNTPDSVIAVNGAVLQMFNHGLSAAGMFFLVGVIYDRAHTRDLNEFGGLWARMPVYGSLLLFISMASLGLPGLGGFVSEFLVVRGSWPILGLATALGLVGLFFTGAYILKALKLVLHGPLNERWAKLSEISTREILVITPLSVLILGIGVWPAWILNVINRAVQMWL